MCTTQRTFKICTSHTHHHPPLLPFVKPIQQYNFPPQCETNHHRICIHFILQLFLGQIWHPEHEEAHDEWFCGEVIQRSHSCSFAGPSDLLTVPEVLHNDSAIISNSATDRTCDARAFSLIALRPCYYFFLLHLFGQSSICIDKICPQPCLISYWA